jgi:hypothetical protein
MPLKKRQWDAGISAQDLAILHAPALAPALAQEDVKLVAVVVRGHVEALAKGLVRRIVVILVLALAKALAGEPVPVYHRVINL